MSEADNQAGAAAASMFSGGGGGLTNPQTWADAINAGIGMQGALAQARQDTQHNPCGAAAFWREIMGTTMRVELDDKWAAVRNRSQFLPISIRDSLERRGAAPPGSDLAGGKPLGEFAVEVLDVEDLIPVIDLVAMTFGIGPLPHLQIAARMDFIQQRMPSGLSLSNGSWRGRMSNSGTKVSEGVYIKNGTYRGATIKLLIERWIQYQIENVSSPAMADARTDLQRMVGDWRSSSYPSYSFPYGIWDEDVDPIEQGSELGILIYMWDHLTELEEYSWDLCNAIIAEDQQRRGEAQTGALGLAAEELANQKLAIEAKQRRDQYMIVAGAMVAALALVQR